MKTKITLLFTTLFLTASSFGQVWQWMKTGGGTDATNNMDVVYGLAKDASNNVYSCGTYHGSQVDIGNGTYSSTYRASWITKKDANGNHIWHYVPQGSNTNSVYNITVDPNGDVIVCGQYSGTMTVGSTTLAAGAGYNSGFVIKINGTYGNPIWAVSFKSAGTSSSDVLPVGVATHTDGTIYVCGSYIGTGLTFNSGSSYGSTTNSSSSLQRDGFLVQLNSSGVTQWVRRTLGTNNSAANNDKGLYDVAVDANGNPVAVGYFKSGKVTMYPGSTYVNNSYASGGYYDALLVSWTSAGSDIGIYNFGSTMTNQDDYFYGIDIMPDNNYAVCGHNNFQATINKINSTTKLVSNTFKPSSGTSSALYVVDCDNSGNIYASGTVNGPSTFGSISVNATAGQTDNLVVKVNTSDQFDWAMSFGSNSYTYTNDIARCVMALDVNDVIVGGAFAQTMTLGSLTATAQGNSDYYLARFGPCTSSLSFTSQPSTINQCAGTTASLSVTTNTAATYQWYKNGSAIDAGGTSTLSFTIPYSDNGAAFYCVATDNCGSVTSNTITATVIESPTITSQPVSQTICEGNALNLSITTTGTVSGYQWKRNGTNINGATSTSFNIPMAAISDAGVYTIDVTHATCGTTSSNNATITINPQTAITTQPVSQTLCSGDALALSVAATGSNLSYQWQKDGSNLVGATGSTIVFPSSSIADAGTYSCVVTGTCYTVTSNGALVSILLAPSIIEQTNSSAVCAGTTLNLSVTAAGYGVTYQWYHDDVVIAGATSSILEVLNSTTTDAGMYAVTINTPSCGSLVSNNIPVLVFSPTSSTISETVCSNYVLNGQTYTETGIYTQTIPNSNGCDSVITLNLTIPVINVTMTLNGETLTAANANATYQWIDCDTELPITGETAQTFTPTVTGNYAVVLTENGCSNTSDCQAVTVAGIEGLALSSIYKVYPNPTKGEVMIQTIPNSIISIVNVLGEELITLSGNSNYTIDLIHVESGIYFVKEHTTNQLVKIIKE